MQLALLCSAAAPAPAQVTWDWAHTAVSPPPGSAAHAMAYDSGRGVAVLRTSSPFGGQTYEYDGMAWQSVSTPTSPPIGSGFAMAYDSTRAVVVLHGGAGVGTTTLNDTWEYDGNDWSLVASNGPAVVEAALSFDSSTGKLVLFGGADLLGNTFSDTWEYAAGTNSWSQVSIGSGPGVFRQMAMAYDPGVARCYLFGGEFVTPLGALSEETWEYRSATSSWVQLFPATRPSARRGLRGTHDAVRGGLLVHGGNDGALTLADTWSFDAASQTWSELLGAAGPSRENAPMVYDSQRAEVVLFGGWEGAPAFENKNETWELGGGIPANAYCFGDGSGAACPCGNNASPGEGCANSSGVGAELASYGSSSVSAHDLRFVGGQLLPNEPALLFAGLNQVGGGTGVLFGDGLRCAGGSVVRVGIQQPDAAGTAHWNHNQVSAAGFVAGQTRHFQVWYRDPTGSACGALFNLSNGLSVTLTP